MWTAFWALTVAGAALAVMFPPSKCAPAPAWPTWHRTSHAAQRKP